MYSYKRKKNSPRRSAMKPVKFNRINTDRIVLESEDTYYMLMFESIDEVRELLSVAHVLYHDWTD